MVVGAGFIDFEIARRIAVFDGAPQASSAATFGTVGISFRARKPASEEEWTSELAALKCQV